ncbi:tRNA (adenosine(37)-N6)-dimethylallyltransferase MiaA [Richelia intracellularis]|jgi:tRNA dimethylallyltransferase|uniref:tRNA (adenosine(37)-N6)-dimethylallyltransferase MiaA n=1 Tax=Richelia intracellularis TaxID=1164990 RepID=UPI00034B4A16|nr:tRNA (adenosine(37)-N6)-dimethylallyltransferase MiaA [Richelia intracellularis]
MTKLIVICGATATGKSRLALELAKRLKSVILSADSRQVYREFNIGTAKPTSLEQELVSHYLIDICTPTEIMTVADYQEQAQAIIQFPFLLVSQDTPLLLVGGTGLYIHGITRGIKIPKVPRNTELRTQLKSMDQTQLYMILQQVDPIATGKIHPNDRLRTIRALEVFYVTGYPISMQQGENPPTFPILHVGLDCDAVSINRRITERTQCMIANGLVAEVEDLCVKYGVNLSLLNTLGYREIKQYLNGEISLKQAEEKIIIHTRQFAKRQRTWFRANSEVEWFGADTPDLLDSVWQRIQDFILTT